MEADVAALIGHGQCARLSATTCRARRSRVLHADVGGLSRLTASSSSVAATVAPPSKTPSRATYLR